MTQRILVATCILMAVISCVALGLAWASLSRQQDLIATWQSTSEKQMGDQQKLFERLLTQSENLLAKSSASSSPSIEWNPVELKFVAGKEDGPPVAGVQVSLNHGTEGSGIPSMGGQSDERGIVRFERVHYGNYHLHVETPWQESMSTSITQRPGEALSQTVVCPDPAAKPANLNLRIEWPKDLADKPLWFRFKQQAVYRPVGNELWRGQSLQSGAVYYESLVIDPNGAIHAMQDREARKESIIGRGRGRGRAGMQTTPLPFVRWESFTGERVQDYPNGIAWPGVGYEVRDLEVLIPVPEITNLDDLRSAELSDPNRGRLDLFRDQRLFFARHLRSAGWPHRVETDQAEKRGGTLWLTPTNEAVESVRAALAEVAKFREAAEKLRADYEKAGAEREQQQQPAVAPDVEKKTAQTPSKRDS